MPLSTRAADERCYIKPGVDQQLAAVTGSIAYLRTVAAAVVETVHAPPATVFWHALHFQMPTAWRFTES